TEPAVGSSLDANKATVQGMWEAYTDDVGSVVNGVPAALSGGIFVASEVPLVAGTNTLAAVITTFEEITDTSAVEITATGSRPAVELQANISSGTAPLEVDFRADAIGIDGTEYIYDFDGNGTADTVTNTEEYVAHTYYYPGVYHAEVTVTDGEAISHTAGALITVEDKAAINTLLVNRWTDLREKLNSLEPGEAAGLFSGRTTGKYNDIFAKLVDKLPQMAADMGDMELIYVIDGEAKYRLRRDEGGVLTTYYVYFLKEPNGIWRIYQF
ncbi:MAG: PKD domain-containing protein, partial [bacterium]|nr:PKD domain-containing protein [bacterium]